MCLGAVAVQASNTLGGTRRAQTATASYPTSSTPPGTAAPTARGAAQQPGVQQATSHISGRTLVGAAAAAGAGVRVSNGLVSVDGPDGGLRLYYDKLTLLLDSGLPLGGNCKVGDNMQLMGHGSAAFRQQP